MVYKSPGVESERIRWILGEIRQSQSTLDGAISKANALPSSDASKTAQIIRLNSLKREVDTSFSGLNSSVATWANRDVPSIYKTGWFVGATQTGANYDFSLPHREALDILSNDAYDDVATRLQQYNSEFGRKIDAQKLLTRLDPAQAAAIQGKSRSAVAQALLTGEGDPKKVAKKLADELWEDGVTIVDAGGNHWEMENYTRMLVRTKSGNAYNSGTLNKYVEEGVERVGVLDGVEDDQICAKANGSVWTIKYATEHVLAHPNCRRAFTPRPGKGRVSEKTTEERILQVEEAADTATQLLGYAQALYDFRQTGEVNISLPSVVRFTTEFVANKTGLPIPLVKGLVDKPLRATFNTLEEFIEAFIDPVLFASGFIKTVPPRALLMRSKLPIKMTGELEAAIRKTSMRQFGTIQNQQTVELLDSVERFVKPALDNAHYLNKSAAFYRGLKERDVTKMLKVITGEFRKVNTFGEIVDDVVGAVLAGRTFQLDQFDAVRSVGRDDVTSTRLQRFVEGSVSTQKFVTELRKFYKTGELNLGATGLSSTLTTATSEFVTARTGIPQLVSEVLAPRSTAAILNQSSAIIEAYVDPVLYAAGLIQKVSDRGALLAAKLPTAVIDNIADSIIASNRAAFGTDQHQKVVALLDTLDGAAVVALDTAGYLNRSIEFYEGLRARDVAKMYRIVTRELRRVNNFGVDVDGIYNAVLDGSVGDLVADGFVVMKEQVRAMRVSIDELRVRMNTTLEELTVVFSDLTMKRAQLIQFLEGKMPSVTRPDVIDELMRVEVPEGRLAGYTDEEVTRVLDRVDANLEEVRKQKDDVANVIAVDFGRPTAEPVEEVLARIADDVTDDSGVVALDAWRKDTTAARVKDAGDKVAGLTDEERRMVADRLAYIKARNAAADADIVPFPNATSVDDAPLVLFGGSGHSVPINTRTKIPDTGARAGTLDTIGTKPPDPTGGRKLTFKPTDGAVDPLSNTDLLTDDEMEDIVAGLIRGFDEESSAAFDSDVLDDYVELFNRIKADGEDGPLFLEIEQFVKPIGDKTTFETFEDMTQSLSLFRVVDGKAAIFGDTVSAAVEEQALQDLLTSLSRFQSRFFEATSLWQDAIAFSDNPMGVFRHLIDADAGDYLARGRASKELFDNINFQILRAIEADEAVDLTGPQVGTLHKYLGNVYGVDNVDTIVESGANGSLFKVTDAKGRSFIVKPMTAQHGGTTGDITMSHGLSDWLSITLGEPTQVMHTTVVPLKQGVGQHVAVMPFFDGEQLLKSTDFFTGNSMARLEFFDRIAMEADPNWGNTMINAAQHRAVSIDTETAFGIVFGKTDLVPEGIGYQGNRVTHTKQALIDHWTRGSDDLTVGFKTPDVPMYELTEAEELMIFGASVHAKDTGTGILTATRGRTITDIGVPNGLPILMDGDKPVKLAVGRASTRLNDAKTAYSWEPVIYTAPNEAEVIQKLARGEFQDEIRDVVAARTDSLQPRSLDVWVSEWSDVDDLEDAIDQFTLKIESNLRQRARSMLNDGSVNLTGGVTTHIGEDGTRYALGELVDLVNDRGHKLTGIVTQIRDDADGVRRVTIANGLGQGKTYDELIDQFNVAPPSGYDYKGAKKITKASQTGIDEFGNGPRVDVIPNEWRSADAVLDRNTTTYGDDLLEHLDTVPQRPARSLRNDPLTAEVPIYNDDGVFVGYGRENIEIIVVNPGDGGIRFTDEAHETFISWERIVDDGSLNDIIKNQLRDVPPSERPRTVHVYFQPIETPNGETVLGFMRMDEREMHISVQSATKSIGTAPGAKTGRTSVRLDSVLMTDEDLIATLDWRGVRKVAEHEIDHAVDAGLEEAQRVTLSVNIHKQLLEANPGVKTADDLDDIARKLTPDSYDPPRPNMSPTEELVDFRATLLEDVENSRLVRETQEVIEDAIRNDVAEPWMQKAYNGIREGDPDAHHEFFADWMALLNPNRSSRKRILAALDDPDKALGILERRALPIPDDWDPNSRAFKKWLAKYLEGPLVPRERSSVRGYWKKEVSGKSLAADIIRQFEEGADEVGGTIHLTGFVPDEGIAVARKANERILDLPTDAGKIHPEDLGDAIDAYIKKYRKNFLEKPEWNIGYWVDKDGDLYLDTSRVVETGDIDAAHFGYREQQKAMFDIGEGKLINLTDEHPDFQTYMRVNHPEVSESELLVLDSKIGSVKTKFGDVKDDVTGLKVPSPRIEEVRTLQGRLVSVSLSWIPKEPLKILKKSYATEYRYVSKNGEVLKKKVTVTQKKMTENLQKVFIKAEEYFEGSIVQDSLDDAEWLTRRGVDFVNQSTAEAGVDAMDDLRSAFKILDDNLIARPPDGFALIVREPRGIRSISGKGPAPNGISVGRRTYISTKWRDLPGTMSRDRVETVLHEMAHQLDPAGTKGKSLKAQGFKSISKYGDLSDDEFWAEAFTAVVTGRADADMTEAVLGLVKRDRGLVRRNDLRFYVAWKNSYMLTAKETGVSVGRIVANTSHLSAGMVAEVNKEAGVWMARMVGDNHKFTTREVSDIRAHYKKNIDWRIEKLKNPNVKPRDKAVMERELIGLRSGMSQLKRGMHLLDLESDIAGAYALQALSFNVEDKVLLNSGNFTKFSLTGSRGMPQVVRGYAVLRGSVTVSDSLGDTKVRSFYNNILDPKDIYGNGDVTVDFHMADMALFVIGMADSAHATPLVYGAGAGLRPLVGDTIRAIYRDTDWAERLDADSPAELQEILWEIWRLGKKKENTWWGDLPRATKLTQADLVARGWVAP